MPNPSSSRPSLFVGSSTEGVEFARAVRTRLNDVAEVTLWDEGFFKPGSTFIETLVNSVSRFDFGVLVLTPDDLVKSRSDETLGPRDNVIFELGLFMGHLGRERTFIVHQANAELKLPSDLSGMTTAQYYWPRTDDNFSQAVGPACDAIRQAVKDLGRKEQKINVRIEEVSQTQERQAEQLNWVTKLLVEVVVADIEKTHLRNFVADGPFMADVAPGSTFEGEVRRLLQVGLIARQPGKGIGTLFSTAGRRDVKEHLAITERGRAYLRACDAIPVEAEVSNARRNEGADGRRVRSGVRRRASAMGTGPAREGP